MNNKTYWILLFLLLCLVSACNKVVTTGSYKSIEIGMTKAEVLNQLKSVHTNSLIRPDLANIYSVNIKSIQHLDELMESNGVGIRGRHYSMDIVFLDDHVEKIVLSQVSGGESHGIIVGQKKQDTIKIVRYLIKNFGYEAFNFIPDQRWLSLKSINREDDNYISSFDVWLLRGKSDYSYTRFYFDGGVLVKVVYSWMPFELP